MGHNNPARAQQAGIGRARRVRWLKAGAVALGVVAAGCGPGSGADFPNPPRESPVASVVVSADGRVITNVGTMACGHDPRLVVGSYPRTVTLVWVNPDTNCNAEAIRPAVVRIRLPEPLGNRPLVHASGGGRIPYLDERDLARVTVLPAGFRLRGEFPVGLPPAGQPGVGDMRIYAPPGTAASVPPGPGFHVPGWPAELVITQQVIGKEFIPPTKQTSQHPFHVRVHGRAAGLLVNGPFYARSVNWADHGYYFTVGSSPYGHKKVLTDAQLIAVADGIRLRPGPGSLATSVRPAGYGHRRLTTRLATAVKQDSPAILQKKTASHPVWGPINVRKPELGLDPNYRVLLTAAVLSNSAMTRPAFT